MGDTDRTYLIQLLVQYRKRNGISQAALAENLSVDQTTVSRWECGRDVPGVAAWRRIRDLLRRETSRRQDAVVRARIRHAFRPASLVKAGAVFVECNRLVAAEIGLSGTDMRGWCVYGKFGSRTDEVTERWERTGIFSGDIALTITLNALDTGAGSSVYMRTLDCPHVTADGDVWSVCDVQRIDETRYRQALADYGGTTLAVSFDDV